MLWKMAKTRAVQNSYNQGACMDLKKCIKVGIKWGGGGGVGL